MDLPHTLVAYKAYENGVKEGEVLARKNIANYIRLLHPSYKWLADSIEHGEYKNV